MLMALSSIVTSRKRKLRELFAVATQVESLPHPVLTNPDAPTSTQAEWGFLQANDIFQYVPPNWLWPRYLPSVRVIELH